MDDRQIKILEDLKDYLEYERDAARKDGVLQKIMREFAMTLGEALEELNG